MVFKIFVVIVAAYTIPGSPGRLAEEQRIMPVSHNDGWSTKADCRSALRNDPAIRGAIASSMNDLEDMISKSTNPGDLANERLVAKCFAERPDSD